MNPVYWLAIGCFLIVLEAFALPSVGFLFAGLAAVIVGIMSQLGVLESLTAQLAWMFLLTAIWAAVLWKPLKKVRKGEPSYNNILGTQANVTKETDNLSGEVRWSGTIMQARSADGSSIPVGSEVKIVKVEGNIFFVTQIK